MAVFTITTTAAQDARIIAAVKRSTGSPVNPSALEVKAFVINWLSNFVQDQERGAALEAVSANPPILPV